MPSTEEIEFLTQMSDAIKRHDLDGLKGMIASGIDVNSFLYFQGSTVTDGPLMHEAAASDFVPGLEALHAAGGFIDGTPNPVPSFVNSNTPLMAAASRGQIEAARWLLQHGADVRAINGDNETALEIALCTGRLAVANVIMQARPDLFGDDLTATARRAITRAFNVDVTRWLLSAGVDPNIFGMYGNSWLMEVQSNQDVFGSSAELLLSAGADVNAQGARAKTALHHTVTFKSMPGFVRLLRAGANPDLPDVNGDTVRKLVDQAQDSQLNELKDALRAWEASSAAQHIISAMPALAELKQI